MDRKEIAGKSFNNNMFGVLHCVSSLLLLIFTLKNFLYLGINMTYDNNFNRSVGSRKPVKNIFKNISVGHLFFKGNDPVLLKCERQKYFNLED